MQIHKPAYQIPLEIYIYIHAHSVWNINGYYGTGVGVNTRMEPCVCRSIEGPMNIWSRPPMAARSAQVNFAVHSKYIWRAIIFICPANVFLSLFPEIRTRNSIWSAYVSVTSYFQIFRFLSHIFFASKLDRGLVVVVTAVVVVVHDRSPISKRKALNTKFRSREEINRPETRVGRNLHLRYQFTIKLRWIWPEPMANHM